MNRPISAKAKYRNTPESDREDEVMHEVTFQDGTTRDVMATDPFEAIRRSTPTK